MNQVGLICDLNFTRHCQFKNYYYALSALYDNVRIVTSVFDLAGLEMLFVGDDHYSVHKDILHQNGFVNTCNGNHIKVVVFGSEKIFNTVYPWNIDNYKFLLRFDDLHHYTYDVEDTIELGTKLHRLAISKHYRDWVVNEDKMNDMVFIGTTDAKGDFNCYDERKKILAKISDLIPFQTFAPKFTTWEDYLRVLSNYRFILSPLGNSNALVTRFYEALLIHSIPVQQVKKNTLQYYNLEKEFDDCIFFEDPEELPALMGNFKLKQSHTEFWLEDYLSVLLKEDGLL